MSRGKAKPTARMGEVYFIQGLYTRLIKIGYSATPGARHFSLQTGSPDPLVFLGSMPGSKATEKALHRQFSEFRSHREWYRPSLGLLRFIEMNATSRIAAEIG